jgi:hypothetical protein
MKITYTPNPLSCIIELDEHEKKELWYKIKIGAMEERMFSAHYALVNTHPVTKAVQQASKDLDPEYWYSENSKLDDRVNELHVWFLEELAGTHCGDCTCVAATCSKCLAEEMIGVRTTEGLDKHAGHKIASAFFYRDGEEFKERSFSEAMQKLQSFDPERTTSATYMKYVPRWLSENKRAIHWLEQYGKEHGFS